MTDGDGEGDRARLLGVNHVALAVGDVDAAVEWYGSLFAFDLRGRTPSMAFLDMGDQFLALSEVGADSVDVDADDARHVGLVVDDVDAVRQRVDEVGAERLQTPHFDVRDPWGNRLQIVAYEEIQFTKADHVLDGMGVDPEEREKTAGAIAELGAKGMAPDADER